MTISSQEAATRLTSAKAAQETAQSEYDALIEKRAAAVRKGADALAHHDTAERKAMREIEVAAMAVADRAAELAEATKREATVAGIDAYNSAKRAAEEVVGKIRELQRDVKPRVLAMTQEAERVEHAIHLANANLPAGCPPLGRLSDNAGLIDGVVYDGDGGFVRRHSVNWRRHEFWAEIAPEINLPRAAPVWLAPQSPTPAAEPDPHAWRAPVFHTLPVATPAEPAPAAAKVTPQELMRPSFVTLPDGM